jgi:hypothetical protein
MNRGADAPARPRQRRKLQPLPRGRKPRTVNSGAGFISVPAGGICPLQAALRVSPESVPLFLAFSHLLGPRPSRHRASARSRVFCKSLKHFLVLLTLNLTRGSRAAPCAPRADAAAHGPSWTGRHIQRGPVPTTQRQVSRGAIRPQWAWGRGRRACGRRASSPAIACASVRRNAATHAVCSLVFRLDSWHMFAHMQLHCLHAQRVCSASAASKLCSKSGHVLVHMQWRPRHTSVSSLLLLEERARACAHAEAHTICSIVLRSECWHAARGPGHQPQKRLPSVSLAQLWAFS